MIRIRRAIAGTTVGALLTVGAMTLAAAPAHAGNSVEPRSAVSQSEASVPLPTDGLLTGLGLGGLADAVCDLLHSILGGGNNSSADGGLGLPTLP